MPATTCQIKNNGLAQFLASPPEGPFVPSPYWEPETDSLILYLADEPSYSKRLNQLMTVFLSAADNRLVGCEIKGVKRILRRIGPLGICVHDHKVDLRLLMCAALIPEPEPEEFSSAYPNEFGGLIDAASKIELDAEELWPG